MPAEVESTTRSTPRTARVPPTIALPSRPQDPSEHDEITLQSPKTSAELVNAGPEELSVEESFKPPLSISKSELLRAQEETRSHIYVCVCVCVCVCLCICTCQCGCVFRDM